MIEIISLDILKRPAKIMDLFFIAELAALVQSLSFSLYIRRRKISSELIQCCGNRGVSLMVEIIVENVQDVFINAINGKAFMSKMLHYVIWDNKNLSEVVRCLMGYQHDISSYRSNGRAVDWLFVLHTLKFLLWTPKATKQWTINEPIGEFAIVLCYQKNFCLDNALHFTNYFLL
ncbi:uncharacterized protein LOC115243362 isoform X1 [Formica exsecta]|uniref:uncharacterized protein LOC115243362 isoform X1 n=1 Tax=Formica exsecta TaxID=72781 RepID=UPI001141E1F4|nr:uncharacterized protein LOC115243362 isoform X1 [Formica exsecta]